MRLLLVIATLVLCGTVQAQVINGESTDDAAYAPRPPARWHSPESQGRTPGGFDEDEASDKPVEPPRQR